MQGSFGSNELHLQRQDIKTMIDRLNIIDLGERVDYDNYATIDSAITMLEDLGNLVNKLQLENNSLIALINESVL